ncbi:MAG TPA: Uma2 family endonuclease, partial [Nannocystis sp.]
MGVPQRTYLTLDEFLAWEETQELRHEFVDGEVFAMVGATRAHNTIGLNLCLALKRELRGRGCAVYHESVKVLAGEQCFYPDVVVTCAAHDDDPR